MHILLIGDCHTYGYGLTASQRSFIDLFTHELEEADHCPYLTSFVFLSLVGVRETLAQLNLSRYDLIILQPAAYDLQEPSNFWTLFKTPKPIALNGTGFRPQPADLKALRNQPNCIHEPKLTGEINGVSNLLKQTLLSLSKPIGLVKQWHYVQQELTVLLEQLHIYRDKVFLLTPTPHREPVSQWLREQSRELLLEEGNRHGMTVLDTQQIVPNQAEFFLPNDPDHLNATGHELVGRALINAFQTRQATPGFFELTEL